MNDPLDLLSLRCFLTAARTLNFREAAKAEHLSPAALGQRIASLERYVGEKLFERTTRRVLLTAAGERAIPMARHLLSQSERFKQRVSATQTAPYTLTLGTRFELGLSWLTPALEKLTVTRPERTIDLAFGDSDELLQRVKSYRIDAAITSSRQLPRGCEYTTLHREDYVFVANPELLREQPLRGPRDAQHHTLIDIAPTRTLFRYFLDAQDGTSVWSFDRVHHLGTIGAIRLRVLSGHGVAVLPEYFIPEDLASGALKRVMPKAKLLSDAFRLTWMRDHPHAEEIEALGEELRSIPLA